MSKYQEDEQFEQAMVKETIITNDIKVYKTPIYQRNANKAYSERNKNNDVHINSRRASQKAYYEKNKEKIIEKRKNRIKEIKENKKLDNNK